jgi:hypothetical protein
MRNFILWYTESSNTLSDNACLHITDKYNQGLKVKIFNCLSTELYRSMAFLPAQTEPLADLMSFNIIGYKAPQEMGTA